MSDYKPKLYMLHAKKSKLFHSIMHATFAFGRAVNYT